MAIAAGDKIPSGSLKVAAPDGIKDVSTDELFGGKKVALFAVPGAFTPTCSAKHLPGFIQNADALKAKGVDSIVCVSVNDAFVMDAWGQAQGATGKVVMAADGNGDFTKAMGMELDGSGFGLGQRSKRYSAVVENGVVKSLNLDAGGEFGASSAETMLDQL